MAATYSPNLRIELIGSGEQANTWGNTTNTNLGTLIEQAICGLVSIDVTAADVTLTNLNGASDQSRQMILSITGTPGVTRTVTAPAVSKVYVVYNGSNATVNLKPSGGTSLAIPTGARVFVYTDGSAFYQAEDTFPGTLTVTKLVVTPTVTGGTSSNSVTASGVIQSDVTTSSSYFITSAATAASAFTLTSMQHYAARQGTIGAGSTVTNQYGFVADSTLIGATNNTGFYSNLAAASNNWNFYAAGSANNYFAGSVGIGQTSIGAVLDIAKNITGGTSYSSLRQTGVIQSDVTTSSSYFITSAATAAAAFTLTSMQHYAARQGTIGAGSTVTNQYGFVADSTLTGATNNSGFYSNIASAANNWNFYAAGSASNYFAGNVGIGQTSIGAVLDIAKNITGGTSYSSLRQTGVIQSDVTTSSSYFITSAATAAATFTLTSMQHYAARQGTIGSGSTVTNQYGFVADSTLIGATNNAGVYSNLPAASNNWNIYAAGSASNYFAGKVGIGTTGLVALNLNVSAPITGGATAYGVYQAGTVQSDVTGSAYGFINFALTQATAFTCGTVVGYGALQSTIGAGSTVTNQFGFYASPSLTGATNNYGFYSNIASATNAWNFYANGSAPNYFAGNVGIGATPQSRLNIVGGSLPATGGGLQISSGLTAGRFSSGDTSGFTAYIGQYLDGSITELSVGTTAAYVSAIVLAARTAAVDPGTIKFATYGTERMRIDSSGNLGLGVIPKNATGSYKAFEFGLTGYLAGATASEAITLRSNSYLAAGAIPTYSTTGYATAYQQSSGTHSWYTAPSGTAGATVTFTQAMTLDASGNLGIGTTATTTTGFRLSNNISGATTSYGMLADGTIQSGVTSTAYGVSSQPSTAVSAFTLGQLICYGASQGTVGAGSTVTAQFGYYVNPNFVGATTNYGMFIGNISSSTGKTSYGVRSAINTGTGTNWNLYLDGTAPNHMAGALGVGTTSTALTSLNVAKSITGGTNTIGIQQFGTVQSDVTGSCYGYTNYLNTAAAAFNLALSVGYGALQGTIGAGSTISNQYGFYAVAGLTGATNNYGFFSNIAAAANRYNFYAAGSADNYFAGNVGIGVAPGWKLQVSASDSTVYASSSSSIYSPAGPPGTASAAAFINNQSLTDGSGAYLGFIGYNAAGSANYAYIGSISTSGSVSPSIVFGQRTGSTAYTERMRLDSAGNTYIESGVLWQYAPAPTSIATTATLTVAQLQTDIINTTGTTYTVTLPTGTAIDAGFTGVPTTNIGFDFHIVNTASGTITLAVNTGVTSLGTLTIATGVSAHFRLRRTAANTYVVYRLS